MGGSRKRAFRRQIAANSSVGAGMAADWGWESMLWETREGQGRDCLSLSSVEYNAMQDQVVGHPINSLRLVLTRSSP